MQSCRRCGAQTEGAIFCQRCVDKVNDQGYSDRKTDCVQLGIRLIQCYGQTEVSVGHDVFYAGLTKANVDEVDKEVLKQLGWFWDDEFGCWGIFM